MEIEIIFEDESELAEYEAINRGFRKDVVVKIKDKKYKLYIVDMVRLQQDFETETKNGDYFISEPLTIIVTNTDKETIRNTIIKMVKCKYFETIDNKGFDW